MNWFDVDKAGLGKLLERRGKEFAIAELISNSWDTEGNLVRVTLAKTGPGRAELIVEDNDPEGFKNLAHAWTLFAESNKKDQANKRGRFNMGEKMVLAVCDEASIISTKGGVSFDKKGRHVLKQLRDKGSMFRGILRMTADEYEQCIAFVRTLIPPQGVDTVFNGVTLLSRQPKAVFDLTLETHIADAEGLLKRTMRKTTVRVYEPLADEVPALYEMGIPVVETNDRWHIDVGQKLPLSFERDNVPPAFLRKLRAEVLNQLYTEVKGDEAAKTWVKAASEAPEARPEAVKHVLNETFGPKHVIFDPSDHEANKLAVSQGYSVIYPRSLTAGQWDHVKEHKLALPAGQVTPSPKLEIQMALDSEESNFIPMNKWTDAMLNVSLFSRALGERLLNKTLTVQYMNNPNTGTLAAYAPGRLIFNVGRLGYKWFEQGPRPAMFDLLIHEFAHDYSDDHLSGAYHDAMSDLGGRLTQLALEQPELFAKYGAKVLQAAG
jgi:hypothetical protein